MVQNLYVGLKLHAMYREDGQYYPASIVIIIPKKKKAPVKVHYHGYPKQDDAWVTLNMLKSKALPKEKTSKPTKATRPTENLPNLLTGFAAPGCILPKIQEQRPKRLEFPFRLRSTRRPRRSTSALRSLRPCVTSPSRTRTLCDSSR
ncbi:SPAC4G8.04 [Symbiodinium sp. CCMP2592]|nr:SPAC4G8.04 [Symbiodinium sp. CCMP2592]